MEQSPLQALLIEMSHRDRSTNKGEEYVRQYKLDKWINQCLSCQHRGYKPGMPEEILQNKYGRGIYVAFNIRKFFKPIFLNKNGLCNFCFPGQINLIKKRENNEAK